jgi:hypothetical protein
LLIPATLVLLLQVQVPLPLEVGTWWEYREISREKSGPLWVASETVTHFVVRSLDGRPFLHQEGGFDPSPGPIERGDDWIRLAPWTGEEPLPLPLAVGAVGPGLEAELQGWRVETQETISVPAGEFTVFRCALRSPEEDAVLWIAPDVGVIRETQGVPGQPPDTERLLLRWSGEKQRAPGAAASPSPDSPRTRRGSRVGNRTSTQ